MLYLHLYQWKVRRAAQTPFSIQKKDKRLWDGESLISERPIQIDWGTFWNAKSNKSLPLTSIVTRSQYQEAAVETLTSQNWTAHKHLSLSHMQSEANTMKVMQSVSENDQHNKQQQETSNSPELLFSRRSSCWHWRTWSVWNIHLSFFFARFYLIGNRQETTLWCCII